jgi:hypothetical protein
MLYRLGSALILIGLILLIVFLVTYQEDNLDPSTLLAGAGLCILGLIFHRRGRTRHDTPPTRFRAVRKILGKNNLEED